MSAKHDPPPSDAQNPGLGPVLRIAFSNAQRTWEEQADLVELLVEALRTRGHAADSMGGWVELGEFQLVPQFVECQPLDSGGVRTLSTLQVSHPALAPRGVFEYQHSAGDDVRTSFSKGFENWIEVDLPVFLDALREEHGTCNSLRIEPGGTGLATAKQARRIMLGPPVRFAQKAGDDTEEHSFCPCCLFTNSFDAFRSHIEGTEFHGVRLYVFRHANGDVEADCRVDGRDWPSGTEALVRYGRTWPDRGTEWRKQYVCIHTPEPIRHGDPGE